MKRYLVRALEDGGRHYFSRRDSAVAFAGRQAKGAWRVAAHWSVVDRKSGARLHVDALGNVVGKTVMVAP